MRRLVREGTKTCEGKGKKVSRAVSVELLWKKEHSFQERRPALSILSVTKDEEGERPAAPHRRGSEEEESEAEEGKSHI